MDYFKNTTVGQIRELAKRFKKESPDTEVSLQISGGNIEYRLSSTEAINGEEFNFDRAGTVMPVRKGGAK